MKKAAVALVFMLLLNSEVFSLIVVAVMLAAFLAWLFKELSKNNF